MFKMHADMVVMHGGMVIVHAGNLGCILAW